MNGIIDSEEIVCGDSEEDECAEFVEEEISIEVATDEEEIDGILVEDGVVEL